MEGTIWMVAVTGAALAAVAIHRAYVVRRDAAHAQNLVGLAMRRVGITPADAAAAGLEQELLQARQRCAGCAVSGSCRRRLGSLSPLGLPAECVNAALFARVAQERERRG